jgi:hypothetical protein
LLQKRRKSMRSAEIWTERLFLLQKKSATFFHARISRSGKGRVSDFSATRVRVNSYLTVLEQVGQNLLGLTFILEAGHHSYREFAIQTIYQFEAVRNFSIINHSFSGMIRFPF